MQQVKTQLVSTHTLTFVLGSALSGSVPCVNAHHYRILYLNWLKLTLHLKLALYYG